MTGLQGFPLKEILDRLAEEGGSDLHLSPERMPYIRGRSGELSPLHGYPKLSAVTIKGLLEQEVFGSRSVSSLDEMCGDYDLDYATGFSHARVNVFRESRGIAVSFRILRDRIPSTKELHLPSPIRELAGKKHGLIAFCGPTGSGKTTSIASVVESINVGRSAHIITLEDPIEYRFSQGMSLVSQREIGRHCGSFLEGLRASLREDPDVIVVGEMRDDATIRTALAASETGHLVFTTLHAANTIEAVDRFLQYFPRGEHDAIRAQLSNSFEAIIAQQLLPCRNGGKVAAFEIVTRNTATVNLIRTGQHHNLINYFNKQEGMMTFKDSLEGLFAKGLIEERFYRKTGTT